MSVGRVTRAASSEEPRPAAGCQRVRLGARETPRTEPEGLLRVLRFPPPTLRRASVTCQDSNVRRTFFPDESDS